MSFSSYSTTVTESLVHNLLRHEIDDLKCSPKARGSMRTTSINIYMNMKDTGVKRKFNIIGSKDRKEVERH